MNRSAAWGNLTLFFFAVFFLVPIESKSKMKSKEHNPYEIRWLHQLATEAKQSYSQGSGWPSLKRYVTSMRFGKKATEVVPPGVARYGNFKCK